VRVAPERNHVLGRRPLVPQAETDPRKVRERLEGVPREHPAELEAEQPELPVDLQLTKKKAGFTPDRDNRDAGIRKAYCLGAGFVSYGAARPHHVLGVEGDPHRREQEDGVDQAEDGEEDTKDRREQDSPVVRFSSAGGLHREAGVMIVFEMF
jgi:hypothetical protein